jgi:hypothetical protein
MELYHHIDILLKRLIFFTIVFLFLLINGFKANAQSVTRVQNLNFGNFTPYGLGGTIIVSPDYTYKKTGDIIFNINSSPSPAIFDLYVEAGKTVQMTYNNSVTLTGNHGGTIGLVLKDSSPTGNGVIVTGPSPTRLVMGGTLTIGTPIITPAGVYSGSFQVSFTVINP